MEKILIQILWIQTRQTNDALNMMKPTVLQSDTTFQTNSQSYKLLIPVYHNTFTNKSEFAGLLFLATETRENIESGLRFVKDTLN